jgi:uncharacterized protein YjiS (DUF1127 family)
MKPVGQTGPKPIQVQENTMTPLLILLAQEAAARPRRALAALLRRRRIRRTVRDLLAFDERTLEDIGLSRSDVVESLEMRDGRDPLGLLEERRRDRLRPWSADALWDLRSEQAPRLRR